MWVSNFKIALATGDLVALEELALHLPELLTLEEKQEATFLIQNAIALFESKKQASLREMTQIKKNLEFIRSGTRTPAKRLDVTF